MGDYQVSRLGTMFCSDDGRLVWDDYYGHQQTALSPSLVAAIGLLSVDSGASPPVLDAVLDDASIRALAARGVLVECGSARDELEQRICGAWEPWGQGARHFHYASRTLTDTPFSSGSDDRLRLRTKLETVTPPPPFSQAGSDVESCPLGHRESGAPEAAVVDVLRRRRSTRKFDERPVRLDQLAQILSLTFDPVDVDPGYRVFPTNAYHRTSASGGARQPIDAYLLARRVSDLRAACYYYHADKSELRRVADPVSDSELSTITGGQDWVASAAAVIVYVARFARQRWKYDMSRAYRATYLDTGHLSQTVYLLCTALELGVTFVGSLRDEPLEQILDLDPVADAVVGFSAIGRAQHIGAQVEER